MNIFVLVAAAAMTLASCQKNEINGPVNKEVHFTIRADFAETKTAITDNGDKTYTPTWAKGDKIGVLFSLEGTAEKVEFENTADAGDIATFEGKHAFAVVEGASEVDGNLYAFYPSSAFNKMYSDGGVRLDLENIQYPTSTSFDPSCDLLIAKPCYYMAEATGEDAEVLIDDMYFARMMSVLKINLNSEFLTNETVKSVSFDADGVDFTGAMKFNLETGEFVGNQSSSQDLSEVKAVYSEEDPIAVAGEKNSAYLVVAPVTIPSGTPLTFTIETENYDIVKTINAPADMVMPSGNIAVINLTIAEENCTIKTEDTSDYSGEWLITGVNEGQVYAAGAYVSGKNNLNVTVPITISDKKINEVDGLAACKMLITKISEGDYAGLYTIQDSNELYLYAASSGSNQLKASTTISANSYWAIAENTDGTYSVVATESSNRNVMQFNYNNASPIFSCYASESMSAVTLYPYSYVQPDTTPRIIVAEEALTQNVDADATELSFNYSLKNISGVPTATVAADATMTNVSATADNGTVTVTFAANEEESPKTATVTLSYEGAEPVSVTITQAAKVAAGAAYYEKVTSAPADWSGTYLVVFESINACWDGSLLCGTSTGQLGHTAGSKDIAINDGKIEYNDSYFVIEKSGTAYTITSAYGDVIGMNTNNNGLKSGDYTNNITINNDNTVNIVSSDGYTQVAYNASAKYIRFYKTTTVSSNNYPKPCLYKLIDGNSDGEGSGTPDPTPDPEEPENPDTPETGVPTTITMETFSATEASMDENVSYSTAKGGGTSAPAVNSNQIRLYQNSAGTGGGTITITAKDGYKLSSVTIGSSMDTKVAYTIGTSTTKSTSASVSANGKYTVDDINATSITFYCMGTSSSSRLYVNYLSATYVAD